MPSVLQQLPGLHLILQTFDCRARIPQLILIAEALFWLATFPAAAYYFTSQTLAAVFAAAEQLLLVTMLFADARQDEMPALWASLVSASGLHGHACSIAQHDA